MSSDNPGAPRPALVLQVLCGCLLALSSAVAMFLAVYVTFLAVIGTRGWLAWLGVGYLMVVAVVVAVDLLGDARKCRSTRAPVRLMAALTTWRAWAVRVITLPLAVVAATEAAKVWFLPLWMAACLAALGWSAIDVAKMVSASLPRKIHHLRSTV